MDASSPTPQRALIDRIRAEFGLDPTTGKVANNRAFRNLENAVRILADQLNSELAHFLLELVQNADDIKYRPGTEPTLKFRLRSKELLVVSNEFGFTDRDVESICSVGDSTKVGIADTTGEKGIGFKSLFKAVDKVTISSNGFKFQFSAHRPCGRVVPEWCELPAAYCVPEFQDKTVILLSFTDSKKLKKVKDELLNFDAKLLLFLRRLRTIEIDVEQQVTKVTRQDTGRPGQEVSNLTSLRAKSKAQVASYAIVPYASSVTIADEARKNHKSTTVTLAFPLSNFQQTCYAYNCLPICTTGFPFLLQADFILSASREGLNESHSAWNNMLLRALVEAFLVAVRRFTSDDDLRYAWLRYLPCDPPNSHLQPLSSLIQNSLRINKVLMTQQGTPHDATGLFYVPTIWRDEDDRPLIEYETLNPPNLSAKYEDSYLKQLQWLGCDPPNWADHLSRFSIYMAIRGGSLFRSQSILRLSRFARALCHYNYSQLQHYPMIPVEGGRWIAAKGHRIFFPQSLHTESSAFNMPPGLPDVEVVRSAYISDSEDLTKLYTKLGVKQGTMSEVCKMIEDAHSRVTAPVCSPEILIQHSTYLFKAFSEGVYKQSYKSFKPLWMCTETGQTALSQRMYQPRVLLNKSLSLYLTTATNPPLIIHSKYLTEIPWARHEEFSTWLESEWKVLKCMRLCVFSAHGYPTANRTEEFEASIAMQHTQPFLDLLAESWQLHFDGGVIPECITTLGAQEREWASNITGKVLLSETLLPLKEIQNLAPTSVPLLQVSKPSDPKWKFLNSLGVTTAVPTRSAQFWLACLRSLLKLRPHKETVLNVYKNLQNLAQYGLTEIRTFFEKNPAVYVPSKSTWVRPVDCVWNSPCPLRHKCVLSYEYKSDFENLFRFHIGIDNASLDDVILEIKSWSDGSDADHSYLKKLFRALKSTTKDLISNNGERFVRKKLGALVNVPFVPLSKGTGREIEQKAGTFNRISTTPDWHIVDSSRLHEAFREKTWLLDFSMEDTQMFGPFLKLLGVAVRQERVGLTAVVQEHSMHSEKVTPCPNLTQDLRARSGYLVRAAKSGDERISLETKINRLANLKIYRTESITTTLTIPVPGGLIRGKSSATTDLMLEDSADGLNIFIVSKVAGEGALPTGTGDALGNYLGVTKFDCLHLIGRVLLERSLSGINDHFVSRGIMIDAEESMPEGEALTNAFRQEILPTHDGNDVSATQQGSSPSVNGKNNATPSRRRGRGGKGLTRDTPGLGTHQSSGPRRTDTASREVERVSAEEDSDNTAQSGIQGELFVYDTLKKHLEPSFTLEHWTSELRTQALQGCPEWRPKDDKTFYADFTFTDDSGDLTAWLNTQTTFGPKYTYTHNNSGVPTRYHIEVKSSADPAEEPFHLSDWQFEEMQRMVQDPTATADDGRLVIDKFVVLRVGGVGTGREKILVVPELWQAFVEGKFGVRARGGVWMVKK